MIQKIEFGGPGGIRTLALRLARAACFRYTTGPSLMKSIVNIYLNFYSQLSRMKEDYVKNLNDKINELLERGATHNEIKSYIAAKTFMDNTIPDEILPEIFHDIFRDFIRTVTPGSKVVRQYNETTDSYSIISTECIVNVYTKKKDEINDGILICPAGSARIKRKSLREILLPRDSEKDFCKERCYFIEYILKKSLLPYKLVPIDIEELVEKRIKQLEEKYGDAIKKVYEEMHAFNLQITKEVINNMKNLFKEPPKWLYR